MAFPRPPRFVARTSEPLFRMAPSIIVIVGGFPSINEIQQEYNVCIIIIELECIVEFSVTV